MITQLVAPGELEREVVELSGDPYRHLFRARRLAVGALLRLVDGAGQARWAEVVEIDARRARLVLGEVAPTYESTRRVELLVAALRPERAAWLVEKATEVGAAAVRFFTCERTPRNYGAGSLARLRRNAASALEQCHGARLPEISGIHSWRELPSLLEAASHRWVLDREGGMLTSGGDIETAAVVIGPEGGFTADEKAELARQSCAAATLGARVLRVETAAVVAAAALLLPLGERA